MTHAAIVAALNKAGIPHLKKEMQVEIHSKNEVFSSRIW